MLQMVILFFSHDNKGPDHAFYGDYAKYILGSV